MKNRLFVRPETLGILTMAMAAHQVAQEDLDEIEVELEETAQDIMDANQQIAEEQGSFMLETVLDLLRCFGVDRKMSAIRFTRAFFELGLKEAKDLVDLADNHLRQAEPMLYSKEKVKDVEKASDRLEKAQLNVARWTSEHREELDEIMREQHPGDDLNAQCADELNNLFLEWDAAGEELHATIRRPAR